MATHPHPQLHDLQEARVRRWCWLALSAALLLAAYVAVLSWATREVEAGVARSIQPLPVLIRDRPETD